MITSIPIREDCVISIQSSLDNADYDDESNNSNASGREETTHSYAFGDGNHPSTRLGLKGLEMVMMPDPSNSRSNSRLLSGGGGGADGFIGTSTNRHSSPSVLDFGCGTGILGIAAKVAFGAHHVTSVDISPEALTLTRKNWEANHGCETKPKNDNNADDDVDDNAVPESVTTVCSAQEYEHKILHSKDAAFDIVVANIPSNTLNSPRLWRLCAMNATRRNANSVRNWKTTTRLFLHGQIVCDTRSQGGVHEDGTGRFERAVGGNTRSYGGT